MEQKRDGSGNVIYPSAWRRRPQANSNNRSPDNKNWYRYFRIRDRLQQMIPDMAHQVRVDFGGNGILPDIDYVVRQLDIRAQPTSPKDGWYGAAQASLEDGARIWLRPGMDEGYQRFTLAHEIGHVLLHDTRAMVTDSSFEAGGAEGQATHFAVRLLVPYLYLEDEVVWAPKAERTIAVLARKFHVPEPIMNLALADMIDRAVDW
jgi:hypothetical protein